MIETISKCLRNERVKCYEYRDNKGLQFDSFFTDQGRAPREANKNISISWDVTVLHPANSFLFDCQEVFAKQWNQKASFHLLDCD